MSSLTLLTATVVVLGLWCWVPTGAYGYNPRMVQCNRAAMPVTSLHMPQFLEGRWYMSHYTSGRNPVIMNGAIYDLKLSIPLAQDAKSHKKRDFFVVKITQSFPTHKTCAMGSYVNPIIGNKMSSDYHAWSFPKSAAGYYISWVDNYVLATDYSSTVVLLSEVIFNARRTITHAVIKVMVRDPAIPPNVYVVDAALHGFCKGDFLNLSSDYYVKVPNDSKLTCFAASASSGAGDN
ncbi:uncharacterized protein [Littorina saxatilis]|uniref:Uncharacterized protein n=1 Tax=Littorina saxatilis TaxID=31220 RepID=A0AAN9ASB1_9CAEN